MPLPLNSDRISPEPQMFSAISKERKLAVINATTCLIDNSVKKICQYGGKDPVFPR